MNADIISIEDYRDSDFETILEMESSRGRDLYCHAVFIRQTAVLFPRLFLVARKENGEIAGYTIGGVNPEEPNFGLVMRLFVSPGSRRTGTGWHLIEELFKRFSLYGAKSVTLTVSPSNEAALNLYKSLGFSESSYIVGYFGEDEDRIVMNAPFSEEPAKNPD